MNQLNGFELKETTKDGYFIDPLAEHAIIDPSKVLLTKEGVEATNRFSRPSRYHGRSFEDPHSLVIKNEPLVDEHGDTYTAFSIKGAIACLPLISFNSIEPQGIRTKGMMDGATFESVQLLSKSLREAGVLTEWPIFHAKPKSFPDGEKDTGLLGFKYMVFRAYEDLQAGLVKKGFAHKTDSVGRRGAIAQGLVDTSYGVMYRAMLCNVRLEELIRADLIPDDKRQGHISSAIKSLQTREPTYMWSWTDIEALSADDPDDQETYITEVLPSIMGENLARFHNNDCFHKYLHPGNWTLAGEIVDLDSVRHPMFGDDEAKEITVQNRLNDFIMSFIAVEKLSESYYTTENDALKTAYAFVNIYLAQRLEDDRLTTLEDIILETALHGLKADVPNKELLGPPRIVEVTQEVFDMLFAALTVIENGNFQEISETEKQCVSAIKEHVEKKVDEYFVREGFQVPFWLNIQKLIDLEFIRLINAAEDLIKDMYDDNNVLFEEIEGN